MSHYDNYRSPIGQMREDVKQNIKATWEAAMVDGNKKEDVVNSPSHYKTFDKECIRVIAASCTQEQFKGYCYGNWMKYRFRMGAKDDLTQDFNKSEKYKELYEDYKHLCTDTPF